VGRTSARRKPYRNDTRKPSNKARSKRICKHKATIKERTKACTRKSRNKNGTVRLATTVYDY